MLKILKHFCGITLVSLNRIAEDFSLFSFLSRNELALTKASFAKLSPTPQTNISLGLSFRMKISKQKLIIHFGATQKLKRKGPNATKNRISKFE